MSATTTTLHSSSTHNRTWRRHPARQVLPTRRYNVCLFDCPTHWRRLCAVRPFSITWKLHRCCCCDGQRLSTVPNTHNYGSLSVWLVCHFLITYWLLDFLTWLTLLFYVHFNFIYSFSVFLTDVQYDYETMSKKLFDWIHVIDFA